MGTIFSVGVKGFEPHWNYPRNPGIRPEADAKSDVLPAGPDADLLEELLALWGRLAYRDRGRLLCVATALADGLIDDDDDGWGFGGADDDDDDDARPAPKGGAR